MVRVIQPKKTIALIVGATTIGFGMPGPDGLHWGGIRQLVVGILRSKYSTNCRIACSSRTVFQMTRLPGPLENLSEFIKQGFAVRSDGKKSLPESGRLVVFNF